MAARYSGLTKVIFTRLPDLAETIYGIGPETFVTIKRPDGLIVQRQTIRLKRFFADLDTVSASILKRLLQQKVLNENDVYILGNDLFISKEPVVQELSMFLPYR